MISYRSLILLDNKDHTCTLYHDTLLMKLETCSLLLCLIHFRQYFYLIVLSAILYNKIKHPKSPLLQFNPFCLLNCLKKYIYIRAETRSSMHLRQVHVNTCTKICLCVPKNNERLIILYLITVSKMP